MIVLGQLFLCSARCPSQMSRAEELRNLAQRITALGDAEEDIAHSFDSQVRSAASSRTASPFSVPRERLQATSEAMAASRTLPKKAPKQSTAIVTTPRGSIALYGVSGLATKAAPDGSSGVSSSWSTRPAVLLNVLLVSLVCLAETAGICLPRAGSAGAPRAQLARHSPAPTMT